MTIQEYLQEHTLNQEFIEKKFGVICEENRLTIPIYDIKGDLLYSRYRHLEGTAKFSSDPGAHPALFAVHKIKKVENVVLCEGEPDAMRLWQEGIPAITGTSGVKTFSEKLAQPLANKNVKIVLDNDEAGQSAIEHYYQILEAVHAHPQIVLLPQEYKDVSEYLTAGFTKEDFDKLVPLSLDDWYDTIEPDEFKLETAHDLNTRHIPPEEWLVDRVLPFEGFAFIIGAEATAKSFYALTLANAVATGTPWLNAKDKDGNQLFTVKKPEKVLIIDKENTKRRMQSRQKGLGIDTENIFFFKFPHYFELADPTTETGFSKMAMSASRKVKKLGIQLIIVDSFADIMIGNENAAGDVQKFFDAFRQLFPGCSILVLHHASKPAQGVVRTSAQRARGSTNIMAQIYSGFFVESVHKSKVDFTLEQTKAGDAEKLDKFQVALKVEPIPGYPGKTKVTAIEYKGIVIDAEVKVAEAVAIIEDAFNVKSEIARQELMDMLTSESISDATARRAIKQMTDEGNLEVVPDPANKSKRIVVWVGKGEKYAPIEE